jgi:hypothetical protein
MSSSPALCSKVRSKDGADRTGRGKTRLSSSILRVNAGSAVIRIILGAAPDASQEEEKRAFSGFHQKREEDMS